MVGSAAAETIAAMVGVGLALRCWFAGLAVRRMVGKLLKTLGSWAPSRVRFVIIRTGVRCSACFGESLAQSFDAAALDGAGAADAVRTLGLIKRLVDGMLGKAANRVHDTAAHLATGERDAAHFVAVAVGSSLGEARAVMATADKLGSLPAVDAAVRDGRLSARQAEQIANTSIAHPGSEKRLLAAAKLGERALKDACQRVRAADENCVERSKRQHEARSFRMWTADDGMVEGRFRLTPEIGGQVKAVVDAGVQKVFRDRRSGAHEFHEAYAADVFAERMLATGTGQAAKQTVHVVIDHAALVRGNTVAGERCEIPGVGPVSVAWAGELLGSAFVTAVIKRGRDIATVAHLGRHVPAEVRTAMLVGGA